MAYPMGASRSVTVTSILVGVLLLLHFVGSPVFASIKSALVEQWSFVTSVGDDVDDDAPSEAEKENFRTMLRTNAVRRVIGLVNEHRAKGELDAIALRGVSFVHFRFGGALLASVDVAHMHNASQHGRAVKLANNTLRFTIDNIAEGACEHAHELNRVSIWVRLEGPEIVSALATPVPGKCQWRVELPVTIAGDYTLMARLLHYNAQLGPVDAQCEFADEHALAEHRIVLVADAATFPFHQRPMTKCCTFCNRLPDCEWSLRAIALNTSISYGVDLKYLVGNPEARCLFFRNATYARDLPNSVRVKDVYDKYGVYSQAEAKRRRNSRIRFAIGLMHDDVSMALKASRGEVLQLGCGRDEMLLKWATWYVSFSLFC